MSALLIQHEPGDEPRFRLVRLRDGKATEPAAIQSPKGYAVPQRPGTDLVGELRWYLEEFLEYPFPPETDRADNVLEALKNWGRQAFDGLFDNRRGPDFLSEAAAFTATDNAHKKRWAPIDRDGHEPDHGSPGWMPHPSRSEGWGTRVIQSSLRDSTIFRALAPQR